jgi:hypothetical protein
VFALVLAPAASSTDATGRPAPHFANPTSTARQLVNRFFVLLAHKDRAGLQRFLSPGFQVQAAAANRHVGVTGRMALNRAGDRAYGNFDFWSVCARGAKFGWARTFEYEARRAGSGRILRRTRC